MKFSRYLSCVSVVAASLLSGCGGGGGSSDPAPTPTNNAPVITGVPSTSVDENDNYNFVPTATDPDGDPLTFSVENLPEWASFDSATGAIKGAPSEADIGEYPEIVVSVSDGEESDALEPFNVTVIEMHTLTISGRAIDSPIANADITIFVREQSFSATADAKGYFSVQLDFRAPELDPEEQVVIRAAGKNEQSKVELITQVGSIGKLIAMAGKDEVVTSDDNSRINVTHLSTARYLLATENNNGVVPGDQAELQTAEFSIDGKILLDIAGVIKLLLEHPDYTTNEAETTLGMFTADDRLVVDNLSLWIEERGLKNEYGALSEAFEQHLAAAKEDILVDRDATRGFSSEVIAGSHIVYPVAKAGWVPLSGGGITFNADGFGTKTINYPDYSYNYQAARFSWTVFDGQLQLSFTGITDEGPIVDDSTYLDTMARYGFSEELAATLAYYVSDVSLYKYVYRMSEELVAERYSLLHQENGIALVAIDQTREYTLDPDWLAGTGWDQEQPPTQGTTRRFAIMRTAAAVKNILPSSIEIAGSWAIPHLYGLRTSRSSSAYQGVFHDLFTLDEQGLGVGLLSGKAVQASLVDAGIQIDADQESYLLTPFAKQGDLYSVLVSRYENGELATQTVHGLAKESSSASLVEQLPTELPKFWISTYGLWKAESYNGRERVKASDVFGYHLSTEGFMQRILGTLDSSYGDICIDPLQQCFFLESPTAWTWSNDDAMMTFLNGPNAYSPTERTWHILNYDGLGDAVILDYSYIRRDRNSDGDLDDPEDQDGYLVVPYLHGISKADLGEWESIWTNTPAR